MRESVERAFARSADVVCQLILIEGIDVSLSPSTKEEKLTNPASRRSSARQLP